jgi:REP element-mobilizing transposase RayT
VLAEAAKVVPMRLLAYCLTPNHWHLLLWPTRDGDLSQYLHWLTVTHTRRWTRGQVSGAFLRKKAPDTWAYTWPQPQTGDRASDANQQAAWWLGAGLVSTCPGKLVTFY